MVQWPACFSCCFDGEEEETPVRRKRGINFVDLEKAFVNDPPQFEVQRVPSVQSLNDSPYSLKLPDPVGSFALHAGACLRTPVTPIYLDLEGKPLPGGPSPSSPLADGASTPMPSLAPGSSFSQQAPAYLASSPRTPATPPPFVLTPTICSFPQLPTLQQAPLGIAHRSSSANTGRFSPTSSPVALRTSMPHCGSSGFISVPTPGPPPRAWTVDPRGPTYERNLKTVTRVAPKWQHTPR